MKAPDTIRIALTCADDSLAVMTYVVREYNADESVRMEQGTEISDIEREIERLSAGFDPEKRPVKSWRVIKAYEIPDDRSFRNAWRDRGRIEVDMPAARAIHLERVRAARTGKLNALDREWMRATGQGKKAEADAVEAKRQRLRDLPSTLLMDTAETPDDLKTLWDNELGAMQDYT